MIIFSHKKYIWHKNKIIATCKSSSAVDKRGLQQHEMDVRKLSHPFFCVKKRYVVYTTFTKVSVIFL